MSVEIANESGVAVDEAGLAALARHVLDGMRVHPLAELSVLLVDEAAMADLHAAGCDLLTITQYLRPSPRHHPVERWVKPEEFVELQDEAVALGFAGVMSGPLVRSSYRAGRLYRQAVEQRAAANG